MFLFSFTRNSAVAHHVSESPLFSFVGGSPFFSAHNVMFHPWHFERTCGCVCAIFNSDDSKGKVKEGGSEGWRGKGSSPHPLSYLVNFERHFGHVKTTHPPHHHRHHHRQPRSPCLLLGFTERSHRIVFSV